jgi:hypothetical protein
LFSSPLPGSGPFHDLRALFVRGRPGAAGSDAERRDRRHDRGDSIGWVELATAVTDEVGIRMTARVIAMSMPKSPR